MRAQQQREVDERVAVQAHVRARVEAAAEDWRDGARRRLTEELRAGLAVGLSKAELSRVSGVSRPSIDAWLAEFPEAPGC